MRMFLCAFLSCIQCVTRCIALVGVNPAKWLYRDLVLNRGKNCAGKHIDIEYKHYRTKLAELYSTTIFVQSLTFFSFLSFKYIYVYIDIHIL